MSEKYFRFHDSPLSPTDKKRNESEFEVAKYVVKKSPTQTYENNPCLNFVQNIVEKSQLVSIFYHVT